MYVGWSSYYGLLTLLWDSSAGENWAVYSPARQCCSLVVGLVYSMELPEAAEASTAAKYSAVGAWASVIAECTWYAEADA